MEEDSIIFLVITIGLAAGLGGTIIGGLSFFGKFKKLSYKWFIGGITAGCICASIGILSWVMFAKEYLSPPPQIQIQSQSIVDFYVSLFVSAIVLAMRALFLEIVLFVGIYCTVLGAFSIVSCARALIARKKAVF